MKLTIKLDEINYGDVAVKVVPLLAKMRKDDSCAVRKLIHAIGNLPPNLVRDIFDAIPETDKNEIIADFAMEHKTRILDEINSLSKYHKLGLKVDDYTIDRDMTIVSEVSEIDYVAIVSRFLPVIRDKLLSMGGIVAMFRPVIQSASPEQLVGLLERFVGDNKEAFFASLINQNQHTLITAIENVAVRQNIRLKIKSVSIET